jgi:hypothetical protein
MRMVLFVCLLLFTGCTTYHNGEKFIVKRVETANHGKYDYELYTNSGFGNIVITTTPNGWNVGDTVYLVKR